MLSQHAATQWTHEACLKVVRLRVFSKNVVGMSQPVGLWCLVPA